jgi:diguanylate cyclase (GGDEF)-like protein
VGDLVLKTVADELFTQLRQSDTIGRLGGEEFGIILQDAELYPAFETAERLRTHLESFPVDYQPSFHITASFGVSILRHEIISIEQWLATADNALYEAKRAGRNRSRVANSIPA